jgi:carbamoyltransferase
LLRGSGFDALHVPSAPADDGNALGAVLYHRHVSLGIPREPKVLTPYLGSEIDDAELAAVAAFGKIPHRRFEEEQELIALVAAALAAGRIIGWAQGRAEFGPRALGNRSILADPRAADMKDRINAIIKFREKYRPLAPAILHEHGPEYFEDYQESPYMERAVRFRSDVIARVPAVVHADGTGRLQTVKRAWNPRFHALLTRFFELTSVPILVNTSFNVMGKPIVHSAQDALTVLVTSGLDAVVVGNYVFGRLD